jgi:hypothetical protein
MIALSRCWILVTYSGLPSASAPVALALDLDRNGAATGTVVSGERRLATITGGDRSLDPGPAFRWEGSCADPVP